MKSKLTSEDVEWLERRLSTAMEPVQPRAEFVHDAKRALLTLPPDEDGEGSDWLPAVSAVLIGVGLALLIAAIVRRRVRLA